MTCVKRSSLMLVLGAVFLMASAVSASATTLTSPGNNVYTSTINAVSEGKAEFHGPFTTITCNSSLEGKVEFHSPTGTTGGKLSKLEFSGCNFHVTVLKPGSIEVHTEYVNGKQSVTANGNGTVTSSGAEITAITSIANCIWTTSNTDIGLLTGSNSKNATLDINGVTIPRTGHSIFCGSAGTWTGSYTVTTPSTLFVD